MHQTACPYCIKPLPCDAVFFRCQNPDISRCPWVEDEPLARFMGQSSASQQPRVFEVSVMPGQTKGQGTCSCGLSSIQVVCPSCHNEIPAGFAETKSISIALIGAIAAGKTNFRAILLRELTKRVFCSPGRFNAIMEFAGTTKEEKEYEKDYKEYHGMGLVIPHTVTARQNSDVRIPFIFQLKLADKRNRLDSATSARAFFLVFYDVPGDDLGSLGVMATYHRYLATCDGLLLLLDPLQIPRVRDHLATSVALPPQGKNPQEIIRLTAELMRRARSLRGTTKIDTPVAVTFSKIDAIQGMFDPGSAIHSPSDHDGRFDVDDAERVSANVRSKIAEWAGTELDTYLQHNFAHSSYFGVSALGKPPTIEGNIVRGAIPFRVEDPFLWILYRLGVIHANDAHVRFRRKLLLRAALVMVTLASLATLIIGGHTLYAYRYDPRSLLFSDLKASACRDPSSGPPERRCGCVQILAEEGDSQPLDERQHLLAPYRAACWKHRAQVDVDPALAGALLRTELAQAVVEPDAFCPAKVQSLKPIAHLDRRPSAPWYPATTTGEATLMLWAFQASTGESTIALSSVRASFRANELSGHPNLQRLLDRAISAAPCLAAWHQARSSGKWGPIEKVCAPWLNLLPSHLLVRLISEGPPALHGRVQAPASSSVQRPSTAECPGVAGLEALLFIAPESDALTLANRAAAAINVEEFEKNLRASEGLDSAHRLWLELLSPWKKSEERLRLARSLTDPQVADLTAFLARPWVRIEDSRTFSVGERLRPDGRLPRLSLRTARETACALLGVQDITGDGTVPWPEPMLFDGIEPGAPQLTRVRLARTLLETAPPPHDANWYICSVTALLQSVRSTDATRRTLDLRELEHALTSLEHDLRYHFSAHDLHCQILAEYDRPGGARPEVDWLLRHPLSDHSHERRARACAVRAIFWNIARSQRDLATALLDRVKLVLPNEETEVLQRAIAVEPVDGGLPAETLELTIQSLHQSFTGEYLRDALTAAETVLRALSGPPLERGD